MLEIFNMYKNWSVIILTYPSLMSTVIKWKAVESMGKCVTLHCFIFLNVVLISTWQLTSIFLFVSLFCTTLIWASLEAGIFLLFTQNKSSVQVWN